MGSILDELRSTESVLVQIWLVLCAAAVGYCIGALNPAAIIAWARKTDLRAIGSGNPGATNAGRAFGWRVGVVVALIDVAKGFVPVVIFERLGFHSLALVAGLAAVLGHVTSPYLRGRGGKGVATSFGAVLAVQPLWAVPVLLAFGAAYAATRRMGLASVAGCLVLVPAALWWDDPVSDVVFAALLTVLIVVRHRANLVTALRRG